MFFLTEASRDRYERNRRKAKSIVSAKGSQARDYVRQLVADTKASARDRAHWRRVARHVDMLLTEQR